ncbi:Peroxidase 73 [Linum perenne]
MTSSLTTLIIGVIFMAGGAAGQGGLRENFYAGSCPMVEAVVQQVVAAKASQQFPTIPATLRLFFHDCFVTGCDASVMVASPNGDAEKDAPDNLSLAGDGFDAVARAKTAVEAICPGVVSCADIIAIAARRRTIVPGGIRPERRHHIQRIPRGRKHNLTQFDMIALSGAHTLGFSHCDRFSSRIYSSPIDPSLNPAYAQQLMKACPRNVDPSIAIDMDPTTPRKFDNVYYQNLVDGKGMFSSDQVLFSDRRSRPTVVDFARSGADFNGGFVSAMRKLGRVGVKTGNQGRIRRDCSSLNS